MEGIILSLRAAIKRPSGAAAKPVKSDSRHTGNGNPRERHIWPVEAPSDTHPAGESAGRCNSEGNPRGPPRVGEQLSLFRRESESYRFTFNKYWSRSEHQVLAYNLFLCDTGGKPPFYGNC